MGVCLVKPQFEAGREKVGKNGVVRDPATHREVLHNAMDYAAANGFAVRGLDFSPVKGPEGNIEYLMFVFDLRSFRLSGRLAERDPRMELRQAGGQAGGIHSGKQD